MVEIAEFSVFSNADIDQNVRITGSPHPIEPKIEMQEYVIPEPLFPTKR